MHFCTNCENMYYVNIDSNTDTISHYCRNCGTVDNNILSNTNTIFEYDNEESSTFKLANAINQYTKYDPTLPRTQNIVCPNSECSANKDPNVAQDVLYIKYDEKNIKFIYLCCNCDKTWNNSS